MTPSLFAHRKVAVSLLVVGIAAAAFLPFSGLFRAENARQEPVSSVPQPKRAAAGIDNGIAAQSGSPAMDRQRAADRVATDKNKTPSKSGEDRAAPTAGTAPDRSASAEVPPTHVDPVPAKRLPAPDSDAADPKVKPPGAGARIASPEFPANTGNAGAAAGNGMATVQPNNTGGGNQGWGDGAGNWPATSGTGVTYASAQPATSAPAAAAPAAAPATAGNVPAAPASAAAPAVPIPSVPVLIAAAGTPPPAPAANPGPGAAPANGAGPPASSGPTTYVQNEGRTVVNDVLDRDLISINGGYLGGSGTIHGKLVIGDNAVMNPGNSPGTLNVDDVEFGNLVIEVASATWHDVVNASGLANFRPNSTIKFVMFNNYVPTDGLDLIFLFAGSLAGLENITYSASDLPDGFHFQVYADSGSDLHVRFTAAGNNRPAGNGNELLYEGTAPAPSTGALALLGLALLAWRPRRRLRAPAAA